MKIKSVKKCTAIGGMIVDDLLIDSGFAPGGRISLPDIDIDFASDGRQKIKEYMEERYNSDGTQNVFSAGTFTTLKIKAVIKDVGRAHGLPHGILNYVTAMIKDDAMTFTGLFKECLSNKKLENFVQDYPNVIEDIRTLMGQPKATSIHASAVIVTPKFKDGKRVECFDYLPIRIMDGLLVSEFDGYSVEEVGLLKEDILATKELMKLRNTINMVNEHYPDDVLNILKSIGENNRDYLTIEDIHTKLIYDDATFNLFGGGHTQNIFQFSGYGMTKFVSEMRPNCINDIIAANALYRPATIEIGDHDNYVKYKRGEAEPIYNWGCFDHTEPTFGIMAYQEQFMKIAQTVGGFSLSKADVLRKAIGKKNPVIMASLKGDFMSGAKKSGCPIDEAETIWHKIELAGKYGFNKSHAAAYGLTAYDGAWLKANFPTAFYTVALQFCKDDDIKILMGEMGEISNCQIVPPDINVSGLEFFTDYNTDQIFWSLSRIKFVGDKAVIMILEDRDQFGPFTSFDDFYIRIQARAEAQKTIVKGRGERFTNPINARVMKNMILAGCFDKVGGAQTIIERYIIVEKLFNLNGGEIDNVEFPADMIGKHYFWSMKQIELSGLGSIDYRRIYNNSEAKQKIKKTSYLTLKEAIDQENEGRRCAVCATVVDVIERSGKTKNGDPYIFGKVQLQQNNETMEYSLWNETWQKRRPEVIHAKDKMIVLSGTLKYNSFSGGNAMSGGANAVIEVI